MSFEEPADSDNPSSSFLVDSPAAPWAEWTNHKLAVVGMVSTPFDEPDHPCGQWTARLRWVYGNDTSVVLSLDFLVATFELEPGTKPGFFLGRRLVADLVIRDRTKPIVNIEPTRTMRLRAGDSPQPRRPPAAVSVQSILDGEDAHAIDELERDASKL
jgi:hypothetical protein